MPLRIFALFAIVIAVFLANTAACLAQNPPAFAQQIEALAAQCDALGLKEQAEVTRGWIIPRHMGRQYLFLPGTDPTVPKAGGPEVIRQWHGRFTELRRAHAEQLFAEAKGLAAREPDTAYRLLYEVLRENPDHAEARRILGITKDARLNADVAKVGHPRLGWPAGRYWKLDTPHFAIVTNHSAREAIELGRQLENLHTLWRQIFFRYWTNGNALVARFAGGNGSFAPSRPRMNVVLFATREQYVAYLAPSQPKIDLTLGIYLDQQRTAYFYAGDTSVYPTWFHEATHQLFQEAVPGVADNPGELRNFWAIEGAALYMESLVRHPSFWTAGGCEADRLQFARYRTLASNELLPSAELTALGREAIQKSPDIRKIYTQAAGLAHFLIDGSGGRYREPFVDVLTAVYRGTNAPDTLAKATGLLFPELDSKYREFLNVTDDDLAGIPDPSRLKNLSLGRTAVTDKGLAHLAACKNLQWLDLSATSATDEGLKPIAAATGLKQLFLEGTKIGDKSLPLIAGLKQLEELDLSNLAITDAGLAPLASMKNLKVLHLSGSPIGDEGLAHLRGLKQLESLETTGTKVTPEGLTNLKKALPKLKSE